MLDVFKILAISTVGIYVFISELTNSFEFRKNLEKIP